MPLGSGGQRSMVVPRVRGGGHWLWPNLLPSPRSTPEGLVSLIALCLTVSALNGLIISAMLRTLSSGVALAA